MRKVRHPHQILEASEMDAGQLYAFVHACESGRHSVSHYTMGGVVADSPAAARRLGHDLDRGYLLGSTEEPQVEMLVAAAPAGPVVTVHMDGWFAGCSAPASVATLVYWRESPTRRTDWDTLLTYLGPPAETYDDQHFLVAPAREWEADPRLHSANWDNPDIVVERAVESAAGWERRMRARAHAAMARMLGFHE